DRLSAWMIRRISATVMTAALEKPENTLPSGTRPRAKPTARPVSATSSMRKRSMAKTTIIRRRRPMMATCSKVTAASNVKSPEPPHAEYRASPAARARAVSQRRSIYGLCGVAPTRNTLVRLTRDDQPDLACGFWSRLQRVELPTARPQSDAAGAGKGPVARQLDLEASAGSPPIPLGPEHATE